jgi:hypothetical protein
MFGRKNRSTRPAIPRWTNMKEDWLGNIVGLTLGRRRRRRRRRRRIEQLGKMHFFSLSKAYPHSTGVDGREAPPFGLSCKHHCQSIVVYRRHNQLWHYRTDITMFHVASCCAANFAPSVVRCAPLPNVRDCDFLKRRRLSGERYGYCCGRRRLTTTTTTTTTTRTSCTIRCLWNTRFQELD